MLFAVSSEGDEKAGEAHEHPSVPQTTPWSLGLTAGICSGSILGTTIPT